MGQLKEELTLNTNQFDSNINSVIKKVEELKNKGSKVGDGFNSSMGKMIERVTGFNGSLKSLTSIVGKLGGAFGAIAAGSSLADWLSNSVQEGIRLAEQGEGIRLAFERLNKGDLLAKLRQETHNTVTDLELMKQAVKFNDFKLNIDQMGTFLAFAQQKAKDTGESIDYMVDSIVTGLGRKSLPILDNLGLSAAEIKEEMKKGGDMTTAVAKIIEKQMQAAGDYVETAADRAKQKEVELQNALEQLGQTFSPLTEASSDFWHSIEIGAIKAINSIAPLINQFTELGRATNAYNKLGGNKRVNKWISMLGDGKSDKSKNIHNRQLKEIDKYINKRKQYIEDYYKWKDDKTAVSAHDRMKEFEKETGVKFLSDAKAQLQAAQKQRAEYATLAKQLMNKPTSPELSTSSTTTPSTKTKTKGGADKQYLEGSIGYYENLISELNKKIKVQVDPSEIIKLQNELKEAKILKDRLENADFVKRQDEVKNNTQLSGLGSLFGDIDDKKITEQIKNFNPVIKSIPEQFRDAVDKIGTILDAYDMGVIGADKAKELIDGINEQLLALGLKPVEVPIEIDKSLQKVDAMKDAFASLESVMSSMGQIFEEPLLDATGMIAAAVANYILGWTEATKKASLLGPIGWAAFGLSTAAQMFAVVAQIKAAGAFANGGVVGGSQYAGDALLARVDSGEMILNGSQQKHLFDLIDKGNSNGVTGNVNFVIRGKDLHGVLYNYDSKMKKVI